MRRLIAFALALLVLIAIVPFVGSLAAAGNQQPAKLGFTPDLYVQDIIANRTTVHQGQSVLLTDYGAQGGLPAYSIYRWYEKMPNQTNYFIAAYASGSVGTVVRTFIYTPQPSRDYPGVYQFRLGVTDSLGDVANSSSIAITVLPEEFTTTIAPVGEVINVSKGQSSVSENFTIWDGSSVKIRYNGTNQSFLAYTNYPKKTSIRFFESALADTNGSLQDLPSSFVPLTALEYTTYANRSVPVNYTATLPYPCRTNSSSLSLFYLLLGQWYSITNFSISQRSCALTFTSMPNATLVVAQYVPPITTTSTTSIFVAVTNTTSNGIVMNSTTTTIPAAQAGGRGSGGLIIGIIIIVIIIAGGVVMYRRIGKKEKEEQNKSFKMPSEPIEPGRV